MIPLPTRNPGSAQKTGRGGARASRIKAQPVGGEGSLATMIAAKNDRYSQNTAVSNNCRHTADRYSQNMAVCREVAEAQAVADRFQPFPDKVKERRRLKSVVLFRKPARESVGMLRSDPRQQSLTLPTKGTLKEAVQRDAQQHDDYRWLDYRNSSLTARVPNRTAGWLASQAGF